MAKTRFVKIKDESWLYESPVVVVDDELDWYTPLKKVNRKSKNIRFNFNDPNLLQPEVVTDDELDWYTSLKKVSHKSKNIRFNFNSFIDHFPTPPALYIYDRKHKVPYEGRLLRQGHTDLSHTYGTVISSTFLIANRIYYIPYHIPYLMLTKTVHLLILDPIVGATVRVGIFRDNRGKVGTLISDNIIQPATVQIESVDLTALLHPGIYWIALKTDDANVGFRKQTIREETVLGYLYPDDSEDYTHLYNDSTSFVDNPVTFLGTGDIPLVSVRY